MLVAVCNVWNVCGLFLFRLFFVFRKVQFHKSSHSIGYYKTGHTKQTLLTRTLAITKPHTAALWNTLTEKYQSMCVNKCKWQHSLYSSFYSGHWQTTAARPSEEKHKMQTYFLSFLSVLLFLCVYMVILVIKTFSFYCQSFSQPFYIYMSLSNWTFNIACQELHT